jgi:O-antigen/teichoic acid export membrane protein
MIKKLFSHTALYGLAPQLSKVVSFLTLPLITAELTDVDYGIAGLLAAYTTLISVLATLGLRMILVNAFFKSPGQYKWAWRQIYGFLTLWMIPFAIVTAFLVYLVVPPDAIENRWLIVLLNVAPLLLFGQTAVIGSTYYQLKQQPVQIAVRSVIFGLLSAGLNVVFIAHYKMGYMGWFWATFIVGLLSNASYWFPLNVTLKLSPILNFKWRFIRNSLKVSLPMVPHYYSGYLLDSSDKMIMDVMNVSTGSIGKYNVAYTVGNMMRSLGIASGLAIGPLLMQYYKDKKETQAKYLVFILQIGFLAGTFVLCLWMKEVFTFLIRNEGLSQMYPLAIVIVMAYSYRPMYLGFSTRTMYNEHSNMMWKLTLGAGLINVILNVVLIPFFGFEAAAFTTFIAYMFMGYAGYYYPTFRKVNKVNYSPLPWLLLTLIFAFTSYYLVEFEAIYKIFFSLGILAIASFYMWKYNKKLAYT